MVTPLSIAHRVTSARARRGSRVDPRTEASIVALDRVCAHPEDDPVLRERADEELRLRSLPGTFAYLILATILVTTASLEVPAMVALAIGTAVLATVRLVAVRSAGRGWHLHFAVGTVGMAALWGLLAALLVAHRHVDATVLMVLLCNAGVAAGSTIALAPARRLLSLYVVTLLGPSIAALAVPPFDRAQIGVLLMHLAFLGYLVAQGRATRARYWQALATSRRLELLNAEVTAASATKSAFLADMSHELRTPMTAIRGFSDLLLDAELDETDRQYVRTIHRNSDHLLAIINDILDLSRVEAGKLKIELASIEPAMIARDVEALLSERAATKGLTLRVACDGRIPAHIMTDGLRVRQVVVNLVSNAIRHTEHGTVSLVVRTLDRDGPAPRLAFVVTDTGIGMNAEQLEQLFRPFSQVDESTARRAEGSGLGLAISARLAELLGGCIEIESAVGMGTTATLVVPVGQLAGAPTWLEPADCESEREAVRAWSSVRGRVLVVEDDDDIREVLRRVLERAGATVASAPDGVAGAELAATARAAGRPYDVIVMDMRMPERDGFATTRMLRAGGYRGAIVAVTARAMAGDRERCLEAGCDAYVSKPVHRSQLLRVINHVLDASTA